MNAEVERALTPGLTYLRNISNLFLGTIVAGSATSDSARHQGQFSSSGSLHCLFATESGSVSSALDVSAGAAATNASGMSANTTSFSASSLNIWARRRERARPSNLRITKAQNGRSNSFARPTKSGVDRRVPPASRVLLAVQCMPLRVTERMSAHKMSLCTASSLDGQRKVDYIRLDECQSVEITQAACCECPNSYITA
mgnify:CR=1 FL=1